jgi:hypothetical protein
MSSARLSAVELVVNLQTAKVIGHEVPADLLLCAR